MFISQVTYRVHLGDQEVEVTEKDLMPYAKLIGLESLASGRYSWLFLLNLYLNERVQGVDSGMVIQEIRDHETGTHTTGTKAATQFQRPPLQGLWHKHYFSGHFVAHNIMNQLSGDKLMKLANQVFDPSVSSVITEQMIRDFAHEVSHGRLEDRSEQNYLTGEWIVFAKHEGQNFYLCASTHTNGDQVIYDSIKSAVLLQFPFLKLWAPTPTP
jgi:hypothetical protein